MPPKPKKEFTLAGILVNPSDAAEFLGIPETVTFSGRDGKQQQKANIKFTNLRDLLESPDLKTDLDKATALLKFALTTNCDVRQIGQLEAMLQTAAPSLAGAIDANKTFDVLNEAIKNRTGFLMLKKLVKEYKINPAAPPSGQKNAIFTAISSGNLPATKFFFDNNYAEFLQEYEAAFVKLANETDFTNTQKNRNFQNLLLYAATNLGETKSKALFTTLQIQNLTTPNAAGIQAAVVAVKKAIEEAQATGFAAQFNKGVELPAKSPKGVATSDHLLVEALVTLASSKVVKSLTWNMQSKCYSHRDSMKRLLEAVTDEEIELKKKQLGLLLLSDDEIRDILARAKADYIKAQLQTLTDQRLANKAAEDLKDTVLGYKNSPTNITETPEQYALRRQEQIDYIIETLRDGQADYLNLQEAAGFINKSTGQISQDLLTRLQEIGYAATFSPSAKNLITIYDATKLQIVGEPQPHIYKSSDSGKTCSPYSALAMSAKFKFKDGGEEFAVVNYHLNYGDKLPDQDWFMYPEKPIAPQSGIAFTKVDYGAVLQELDTHLRTPSVTAMIASGDANRPSTKFRGLPNSQITEEVATNIESKDDPKELAKGTPSTNFSAAENGEAKSYDAVMVFSAGGSASVKLSENNYSFQESGKKVAVQLYSKAKGVAPAMAAATTPAAATPAAAMLRTLRPSAAHTAASATNGPKAAQQGHQPSLASTKKTGVAAARAGAAAAMAAMVPLPQSPAASEEAPASKRAPTPTKPPKAKPSAPKIELSSDQKLVEALKTLLGENFGEKLEKDKGEKNPLERLSGYSVTSKQSKAFDVGLNYLFKKEGSDIVIKIRINKNTKDSMRVSVAEAGFFSNKKLSGEDEKSPLEELAQAIEKLHPKGIKNEDDALDISPDMLTPAPDTSTPAASPRKAIASATKDARDRITSKA